MSTRTRRRVTDGSRRTPILSPIARGWEEAKEETSGVFQVHLVDIALAPDFTNTNTI